MKTMTTDDVVSWMKRQQGKSTQNDYAASLGISGSHLSDIYSGKRGLGKDLLMKLGLEKRFMYTRTTKTT